MATLEDRVRRLEDRADLQDLVAAYFLATDDDDFEQLGASFASTATFAASGYPDSAGRADVVAFLKAARADMGQTVHTPHYVHLEFQSDDAATGVVVAHLELGIGGQTHYAAVRYLDRYRRENGGWVFAHREMRAVYVTAWADIGSALTTPLNIRWPGTEPAASDFPRRNTEA